MQRCGRQRRPTQADTHCRTYPCTIQLWYSNIILVTNRPLRPRAVKSLCAKFNKLYQAVYTEQCWWKPLLLLLPTEILAPCCQRTKRRNWPKSIAFCIMFWMQLNAVLFDCQTTFQRQDLFFTNTPTVPSGRLSSSVERDDFSLPLLAPDTRWMFR